MIPAAHRILPAGPIDRKSVISASEPDWSRESKSFFSWMPSKSLLASLRSHEKWSNRHHPYAAAMRMFAVLRHRFWSVVTGADIPLGTKIGGGLQLMHPNGVVIHSGVIIGPNCLILQQVTLGTGNNEGVPTIGGHVDIGAGAKVLGKIAVGDHAKIGANAVVLSDVPPFATAVGVPAQIVVRD
jgi:serine O-acetyltransferase